MLSPSLLIEKGWNTMSLTVPGQNDFRLPGSDVENPFNERHDVAATTESIKQILAGGTPNWVKFPHEYKAMAKESFQSHREDSERMAAQYKWADQDMLTNKAARKINVIKTRDFVENKLKSNGIKCVLFDNGFIGPGGIPTVALFCVPPSKIDKLRPVCYLDVPMMWEWSVLKLDRYGIPAGEESRGWRTVAIQLVEKEIITEAQCHKFFGVPPANKISERYYRSLWEKRHGKPYVDEDDRGLPSE
jgi:hypothetical protein